MARYSILARMMVMPKPMAVGEANTPADAVRMARDFAKQGKRDIQIGDNEAQQYFPIDVFAAKHGIR